MNAAARLFNQGALSRGWVVSLFLTHFQFKLFTFFFLLLFSALSMVYVTHLDRDMQARLQQTATEQDRLHVQRGQLLLEKSSLTMQARIETLAKDKLGMVAPEGKAVIIINLKDQHHG